MNEELRWFLLGLAGMLSQIGGTWWKGARRFLIPIAMACTWTLFKGWTPWLLLVMLVQWASYCTPTTFKGDSIPNNGWFNWAWLPIKGCLICLSPVILNPAVWPVTVILGLIWGLFVALSNIKETARFFDWKFCEFWSGVFPATVLCMAFVA